MARKECRLTKKRAPASGGGNRIFALGRSKSRLYQRFMFFSNFSA